ncbi:MAG: methyl-accepting chemotaxis protein, partial [Phycisphaerales bacterium]
AARGDGSVGYAIGPGGQEVIGAWFHLPALRWSVSVEQDASEAFAPARRQAMAILAVAGATAIPAVFVALGVAGRLARPIREASTSLVRTAEGDLDHAVAVRGRGEIRLLLAALDRMVRELGSMLLGIRTTGRDLAAVAGEVRETASNQHRVVQDLSSSAAQIASAIEQMSATGRQLANTASGVADAADETAKRAERGREGLDRMRDSIGEVAETSRSVSGHLAEIRDRAEGVGAVVVAITRVANRTNLLSINAAIEAEKAGPHGRGFQVVAAEIGRLAAQTAAAAHEVESIVASMQGSVAEGASSMQGLSAVVTGGVAIASEVAEDLSAILESVGSLRDNFGELRGGIEAQSEGATQIRDAMRHLATSAETARTIVERLRQAGDRLEQSSGSLQRSVERFRLPSR